MKNCLDLNKKPIFFAADFATEEMCSFQDRSDATETPNMDRLSHIFRVFEPKRKNNKTEKITLKDTKEESRWRRGPVDSDGKSII